MTGVKGEAAAKLLRTTEKKLLEIRVRQCKYTLEQLRSQESDLKKELFSKVEERDRTLFVDFLNGVSKQSFEQNKTRQRAKFDKLLDKKRQTELDVGLGLSEDDSSVKDRWVVNLSSKSIDPATTSLLQKGLNFAITPKTLPTEEIIVATELASRNLNRQSAADLKSEVARSIKKVNKAKLRPNISREESIAMRELKKDDTIMVLPADKGKATVIMDTTVYKDKLKTILDDSQTYEILKKDPTTTYKNKLINLLKEWEKNGKIPKPLYYNLYPTSEEAPKMYGLPKIHKKDTPLRPIVSSVGSITQCAAKHLEGGEHLPSTYLSDDLPSSFDPWHFARFLLVFYCKQSHGTKPATFRNIFPVDFATWSPV